MLSDKAQKQIDKLESLIEFLKANPAVADEYHFSSKIHLACQTKERLLAVVKGSGKWKKSVDATYFNLQQRLPCGVELEAYVHRDVVCERVETTVKKPAEAERILPERKIEAKPEREEIEVSWVCPDSLLADKKEALENVQS